MRRVASPSLAVIDASAMYGAIKEFNELGRARFLGRYGIARSTKFYLIYDQRLYDTKSLVAAAFYHATGRGLRNIEFAGGVQTKAVFRRLATQDSRFAQAMLFEDTLGELHNLSNEYDRIPRSWTDLREL